MAISDLQAAKADALIKQGRAQESYFFSEISSPEWISPLRRLGYFKTPPAAEGHGDNKRYARWPELLFLSRMADVAPELVAEVLCEMDTTENFLVHDEQVRICLALPPQFSARVVRVRLTEWIVPPLALGLPKHLADLAIRLGTVRQPGQATAIVKALVSLQPVPATEQDDSRILRPSVSPTLAVDDSDYARLLDTIAEGVGSATESSIQVMSAELESVLTEEPVDSWCQDLSRVSSRWYDLRSALTYAIGQLLLVLGAADREAFGRAMHDLRERTHRIFARLWLEIAIRHRTELAGQIQEALADPELVSAFGSTYEFRRLAIECFALLTEAQRTVYLSWLAREPDVDSIRRFHKTFGLEEPTDEQIRLDHERTLRDHLHELHHALPPDWISRYEELLERHGPARAMLSAAPEPVVGAVGDKSPFGREQLSEKPVAELVDLLRTWKPEPGARVDEPTIGALAKQIELCVAANPAVYASSAPAFAELDPAYASALLSGLRCAVRESRDFGLDPVIELCKAIVAQSGPYERDDISHPYEVSWSWTQGEVAELAEVLFKSENLNREDAPRLVDLIQPLCSHPEPSAERESQNVRDFLSLAINSTRGKAIEAVLHMLVWIDKYQKASGSEDELATEKAAALAALEARLSPDGIPSRADVALLASWFPNLCAMSQEWARTHADSLFSLDPARTDQLEAAWGAFILYTHPYAGVLEILVDQYVWACTQLDVLDDRDSDVAEHLVQHLMVLYGREAMELEGELLVRFCECAPARWRARALAFVGYSLPKQDDEYGRRVLERFSAFAEARIAAYESEPSPDDQRTELRELGVWFENPLLTDDWVIGSLRRVLLLTAGRLDNKDDVAQRLARLEDRFRDDAMWCIDQMARSDDERWWIESAADSIKQVIARGIQSDSESVRDQADALQNHLVGSGFWEFRTLA